MSLPQIIESHDELPETVFGYVSVKSQGGQSCFDISKLPSTAKPFYGKPQDHKTAEANLTKMGFQITAASRLGMAITGPPGAWEELTGGRLVTTERLVIADSATQRYVTHIDIVGAK